MANYPGNSKLFGEGGTRRIGSVRSKEILKYIEKFKVVTTEQIYYLIYPDIKTGQRVATMKLRKLYQTEYVKRFHDELSNQLVYYLDNKPKPEQWKHRLAVAWVYIWFKSQLRPGENICFWKTEVNYKYLRPDALIGISGPDGKRYYYIELDRHPRQLWEKAPKYNRRYEEQNQPKGFPEILCVAANPKRVDYINKRIEEDNTHNLKFLVRELSELQKEVKAYAINCVNTSLGGDVHPTKPTGNQAGVTPIAQN